MYLERRSRLQGAAVWMIRPNGTDRSGGSGGSAVLPDGAMDLIWLGDRLIVAGPDTHPQPAESPSAEVVGLRFAPGVAPSALGVPADAVRNTRVALSDLWARGAAQRAHDQVAAAVRRGPALEQLAGELLEASPSPAWAPWVAHRCAVGDPTHAIAADLGWSERTLHRHSRQAYGYGTATLSRILRFQRAAELIRAGCPLSAVAADTGYADQPHLSREVRALSGRSPARLRG